MFNIEKKNLFNELLTLYGDVLTENQYNNMVAYYSDDYSLSEIAENNSVSRNAVSLSLKQAENELTRLEDKIHLLKFLKWLKEKLNEIKDNEKDEHNLSLIESILKEIEDGI